MAHDHPSEIDVFLHNLNCLMKTPTEFVELSDEQIDEIEQFIASGVINQKIDKVVKIRNEKRRVAEEEKRLKEEEKRRLKEDEEKMIEEMSQLHVLFHQQASCNASDMTSEAPSDLTDDRSFTTDTGPSVVDFTKFISEGNSFLELKADVEVPKSGEDKPNSMGYPLGVEYDEYLKVFVVCDQDRHCVVKITEDRQIQECSTPQLRHPSAVCSYRVGKSVAILASRSKKRDFGIYIFDLRKGYLREMIPSGDELYGMNFEMRGLTMSVARNFVSIDMPHGSRRLRVIKKKVGAKTFDLPGAQNPSFIASHGSTVAVSDLGTQKVYIIKLEDANFDNVTFNIVHIIHTHPSLLNLPKKDGANESGFFYVSGMQFDVNGLLLIGDAKGHTIKLYDYDFEFVHRLSSNFPLPYLSSFRIASTGEALLLDVHGQTKFRWAKLSSRSDSLPWVQPGADRRPPNRR